MVAIMSIARKDGTSIVTEESIEKKSNTLVIILGGYGYTLNHPILYYTKSIVKELSCDYLGIDFNYKNNPLFLGKTENDKDTYFEDDVVLAKEYIKKCSKPYKKIVFIGKSMGTSIIKRLFTDKDLLKKSASVLITPGTEWSSILRVIIAIDNPILVMGSMADSNYRIEGLNELKSRNNIEVLEFQDANHALETGNVEQDFEILKTVISAIREFIKGHVLTRT